MEKPINSIVCVIPADKVNQGTDVTLMKILAVDGLLKDPENTFDSLMVVFTGADKTTDLERQLKSEAHLDVLYKDAPLGTKRRYCFTKGLKFDGARQPLVDAEGRPSLDITEFEDLLKSMPIKTLKSTEMKEDVLKKYLHALNINDPEKVNEIFKVIMGERNLRQKAEDMCEKWENGDHKAALKQERDELLKKSASAADQKERDVAEKQLKYLADVGYPGTTTEERRVNKTDLIDFAEHLKLRSHRSPGNFPKGVLKKGAQRHLYCYARKNIDYDTSALEDIIEKRLAAKPLRAANDNSKEPIPDLEFKEAIKKLTLQKVSALAERVEDDEDGVLADLRKLRPGKRGRPPKSAKTPSSSKKKHRRAPLKRR